MMKQKKHLFMKSIHNYYIFIFFLNIILFLYCTRFPLCEPCIDGYCPPCISETQIHTLFFVSSINLIYITITRSLNFLILCLFYIVHVLIIYLHDVFSSTWLNFLLLTIYTLITIYIILFRNRIKFKTCK